MKNEKGKDENLANGQPLILVVDDESLIRDVVRATLIDEGFPVVDEEATGEAALVALRERAYHVVILDKNMPGMSGIETLRLGKKLSPHCQFIILTAYGNEESVIRTIDLGAHSYLTKPLDAQILIERVRAALAEAKAQMLRTQPASKGDEQTSLGDTDLQSVKDNISSSSKRLQELGDRLRRLKQTQKGGGDETEEGES